MMEYAIVYSSKTGNTKMLADALQKMLPRETCVYFGEPDESALSAGRLYIGFWTDKGSCDGKMGEFLERVKGKELFLFGTAGFGGDDSYFEKILQNVRQKVDPSNTVIGSYMCQGKMPMSVRERYEKMLSAPTHVPNVEQLIENFDKALQHPNQEDLDGLKQKISLL